MDIELLKNIFKSEVDYLEIKKRLEDETDPQVAADYFDKLQHDEELIAIWKKQLDVDWNSAKILKIRDEALEERLQVARYDLENESIAVEQRKELLTPEDVFNGSDIAKDVYFSKREEEEQGRVDLQEALVAELLVEGEIWQ